LFGGISSDLFVSLFKVHVSNYSWSKEGVYQPAYAGCENGKDNAQQKMFEASFHKEIQGTEEQCPNEWTECSNLDAVVVKRILKRCHFYPSFLFVTERQRSPDGAHAQ